MTVFTRRCGSSAEVLVNLKLGKLSSTSTQPGQSPDLNTNDLVFFASLQKDVEMVAKKNVLDLLEAVQDVWHACPVDKIESVWRILYVLCKGILATDGDNSYPHHTCTRTSHAKASRAGDRYDQAFF